MKRSQEREWWIILFVVGIIVLNYPLVVAFNRLSFIAGFPLFFLYIYVGWIISILIIFLFVRADRSD